MEATYTEAAGSLLTSQGGTGLDIAAYANRIVGRECC
jgi:hypothetical protein